MSDPEYNSFNDSQFYASNLSSVVTGDYELRISVVVISALIATTGLTNALMLFLIRSRPRKSRFDVLLTNLAIANLLVMLLTMSLQLTPISILEELTFFKDLPLYLIGFLLVCIAIDRYKDMKDPYSQSNKSGGAMVITSWSLAVLCTLSESIISRLENDNVVEDFFESTALAPINTQLQELLHNVATLCALYGVPAVIIICLYALTYVENFRKSKIAKQMAHSQPLWTDDSREVQEVLLKMSATMACFFIICSSPFQIAYTWFLIGRPPFELRMRDYNTLFIIQLTYSAINPIIYIIFYIRGSLNTVAPITPTSG